jgi:hypothetical protein
MSSLGKKAMGWTAGIAALGLLIWGAYAVRSFSMLRGLIMIFYRHPALFTLPFLVSIAAVAVVSGAIFIVGRLFTPGDKPDAETYFSVGIPVWFFSGLVALLVALIWTGLWSGESLYKHSRYQVISAQSSPETVGVPIKTAGVALSQFKTTLNSSTDAVSNVELGAIDGHLVFSGVRTPNGSFRSLTHSGDGIVLLSAESSQPQEAGSQQDSQGTFKYNPGSSLAKNLSWHAHDTCYTCDITEVIGVPSSSGPLLVAPFVKWEGGWFVKHPVFRGVFVENTHGSFQMLSPRQAESDAALVSYGDVFPKGLADAIAASYAYKEGLANYIFTHKDQYGLESGEVYLEEIKGLGLQYVGLLSPSGENATVGAIITVSALNGQVRIWPMPSGETPIDAEKANELANGESGLGLHEESEVNDRPVLLPDHRLQYAITATPREEARVSENLLIEARTQSVLSVLQPDPKGDSIFYDDILTGTVPKLDRFNGAGAGTKDGLTSTPTQEGKEEEEEG